MFHATTICAVKRGGKVAIAGDGQVTMGNTVAKKNAMKLRRLYNGAVLSGFAGATADAFALFDKFEKKLNEYSGDIARAAVELAREWRSDKFLRKLEALLIVANKDALLLVTGNGDVLEPDEDVVAIGSGGDYARAAAIALLKNTDLPADEIVQKSVAIAADICIYTNTNIKVETL